MKNHVAYTLLHLKMIEMIKNEFYDHNGVKSQIHTGKISETLPNTGS